MDSPTGPATGGGGEHRMPRWVKGVIIAAVVAVVLGVVVLASGNGGHGPARHLPGSGPESTHIPEGHTPPVDHR